MRSRQVLAQQLQKLTVTTRALSRRVESNRILRDATGSSAAAAMARQAAAELARSRALRDNLSRQFYKQAQR